MADLWPWAVLVLLGAFHGINPAMGWLFAVALGLQERSRAAVLRALPPIAAGHAASIAAVATAAAAARAYVDPHALRLSAAGALIGFGAYRLLRGFRHRSRVGMRVGFSGLALWSFLVSTAHGAGLMVVPALLGLPGAGSLGPVLAATTVHTLAMLAVAAAVAVAVFDRVGLGFLRKAWVNVDLVWAVALVVAGAVMLVV